MVASRDRARAEDFARKEGVDSAAEGYESVVDSPEIDAVYVALPNSHHAVWSQRALEAGKAVLCEKPLCVSAAETDAVLGTAASTGSLLWESFVFVFQDQHRRLLELLESGAIGQVRELVGPFHFNLSRSVDIRLSAELAGGALADLGLGHQRIQTRPGVHIPFLQGIAAVRMLKRDEFDVLLAQAGFIERPE